MKKLERLINEMKLANVDKTFPTVPKEVREKIKSKLSKGSNLDDKGLNLLNLYNDGKVSDEKLGLAIKHLKRAQLPKGERVSSYDELRDKSIEAKWKALEPEKVAPEYTVKSKEFPKEKLFFPQSYAKLVAFSKYAIKQQGSKEDGERVNRWCVADENEEHYYKRYASDNSKFIVIVFKDKNGNLIWKNRYLYSINKNDKTEVANRLNDHTTLEELPLSSEARVFITNYYKLSTPKKERVNADDVKPWWVKKAKTRNAKLVLDGETVVWKNGTWVNGTWVNGTWENGTWLDGTFAAGNWLNGNWKNGIWEKPNLESRATNSIWHNGTWDNGSFISGTWKNGTWKNGVMVFSTWKDGVWEDGSFLNSTWENGTFKGGKWHNGFWEGGTWNSGWIYDKKKIGNFKPDWKWKDDCVLSPINPVEYWKK